MKWYERQKQMYAQKDQPQEPVQPQTVEPQYEEPMSSYEEPVQTQEPIQEPYEQPINQDPVDQRQYDEMMEEAPAYEQQPYETQDPYMNQQGYEQPYEEPIYNEPAFQSTIPSVEAYDSTTISKGTVLTGNIETDGDLIIRGHVKGDIICNANLSIYGVVEGTINCNNAYFDQAVIIGDVGCSGNLQITQSSTVNGNVEAYEMLNGGRIKGNATVQESLRFLSTSAIVGDISANDVEVERGAVIQGNVMIRQELYFDGQ